MDTSHSIRERWGDYAVAVLAGQGNVELTLAELRDLGVANAHDVVVAGGEPPDESVIRDGNVRAYLPAAPGEACREAMRWAMQEGYPGLITLHAGDLTASLAVPTAVRYLERGFGLVQGSRFVPGGECLSEDPRANLGERRVLTPLTSLLAGFGYTDGGYGLRGYSVPLLEDATADLARAGLTASERARLALLCAPRLGYRTVEVPLRSKAKPCPFGPTLKFVARSVRDRKAARG